MAINFSGGGGGGEVAQQRIKRTPQSFRAEDYFKWLYGDTVGKGESPDMKLAQTQAMDQMRPQAQQAITAAGQNNVNIPGVQMASILGSIMGSVGSTMNRIGNKWTGFRQSFSDMSHQMKQSEDARMKFNAESRDAYQASHQKGWEKVTGAVVGGLSKSLSGGLGSSLMGGGSSTGKAGSVAKAPEGGKSLSTGSVSNLGGETLGFSAPDAKGHTIGQDTYVPPGQVYAPTSSTLHQETPKFQLFDPSYKKVSEY